MSSEAGTLTPLFFPALCIQECVHGRCLAPNQCQCVPGWRGDDCSSGEWLGAKPPPQDPTADPLLPGNGVSWGMGQGHKTWEPREGKTLVTTPLHPPHATECPPGVWGPECDRPCNCGNNSSCDPRSGACFCPAGLQPPHCRQPCLSGHYGPGCQFRCQCHGAPCDPQTGACFCPPERTGPRYVMGEGNHDSAVPDRGP